MAIQTGSAGKRKLQAVRSPVVEPPLQQEAVADIATPDGPAWLEPGEREAMIAEAAYYRAEARGFQPGHELRDWLDAELEVDSRLASSEYRDR